MVVAMALAARETRPADVLHRRHQSRIVYGTKEPFSPLLELHDVVPFADSSCAWLQLFTKLLALADSVASSQHNAHVWRQMRQACSAFCGHRRVARVWAGGFTASSGFDPVQLDSDCARRSRLRKFTNWNGIETSQCSSDW